MKIAHPTLSLFSCHAPRQQHQLLELFRPRPFVVMIVIAKYLEGDWHVSLRKVKGDGEVTNCTGWWESDGIKKVLYWTERWAVVLQTVAGWCPMRPACLGMGYCNLPAISMVPSSRIKAVPPNDASQRAFSAAAFHRLPISTFFSGKVT